MCNQGHISPCLVFGKKIHDTEPHVRELGHRQGDMEIFSLYLSYWSFAEYLLKKI